MHFVRTATTAVALSALLAASCALETDDSDPGVETGEETSELSAVDPAGQPEPFEGGAPTVDPGKPANGPITINCPITEPWCWQDDMDGIPVNQDNCPFTWNPDQSDCDGDRLGNACDSDDAIWQNMQAPGTPPICWVDRDRHFGFYTLEFRGLNANVDVSSCGSPPNNYQYTLRSDINCTTESTYECCLRRVPAGHPYREALCSHIDQNFCEHWPPPAPNPPPTTCSTQTYIFCLTNPEPLGNPPPDCNQFEVLVNACSYNEARTLAQNHAVNWRLADGACAECP